MSKKLQFNFEGRIIRDKEGNQIDLSKVKTLEDLKDAIIYEIEFPYCKNCGFYSKCPYKRNTKEETCALLDDVMRRYIDMNIKSINYQDEYEISEFIKSCYYVIHMFKDCLDFLGIYSDDYWNANFESAHPRINSLWAHKILINLSKYLESIRKIKIDKLKKFAIIVEGESDEIILKSILNSLGVLGINFDTKNSIKFYILNSKARAKKERIISHLKRFKEINCDYFLFLDKDAEDIVKDLERARLIEKDYVFYFESELEEEYPIGELIKKIERLKPELKKIFSKKEILNQLKKGKTLKKSLGDIAHEKEKSFDLEGVKVDLAKLISKEASKELEKSIIVGGVHRGDLKPKSKTYKKLVEKIRPLADKLKKISKDFYVIEKSSKKK
jgi:hypothetical protein